ncbi:MAG: hypothetical protein IPK26_03295 [Planctomycetes bacterium]|nr:hypothetical protein [Planctomycetota bacterium]
MNRWNSWCVARCSGILLAVAVPLPLLAQQSDATRVQPGSTFLDRAARRAAYRDPAANKAIAAGVAWLCAHQDADGRWDCDGFMKHDPKPATTGGGARTHDVGVTGLALLVLLAQADPAHDEPRARAAAWLRSMQEANGLIGGTMTHDFIYDHVIALHALIEDEALHPSEAGRRAVVAGLDALDAHRNPFAAWRYQPKDNDNDTSVTAWCLGAFALARQAGIRVSLASVTSGLVWLDTVDDPSTGRVGYSKIGEQSARRAGDHAKRFPTGLGEAMTAAAWHARVLLGFDTASPAAQIAGRMLLARPPASADGAFDLYYWFHGSQTAAHFGGAVAKEWQQALHKALLPRQRWDGPDAGSWNPTDAWGEEGGRVASTAQALLALQAPYRHGRLDVLGRLTEPALYRKLIKAWQERRFGDFTKARAELLAMPTLTPGQHLTLTDLQWDLEFAEAVAERQLGDIDRMQELDHAAHHERVTRVAAEFAGMGPGQRAAAILQRYQTEGKLIDELAASRRLHDVVRRHAKNDKALRDQLEKLVKQWPATEAARRARIKLGAR